MRKQLYPIQKKDWLVTVKGKNKKHSNWHFSSLSLAARKVKKLAAPGSQVQIFKVSYEFRDAYVVADPRAVKARMKS